MILNFRRPATWGKLCLALLPLVFVSCVLYAADREDVTNELGLLFLITTVLVTPALAAVFMIGSVLDRNPGVDFATLVVIFLVVSIGYLLLLILVIWVTHWLLSV